MSLRYYLFAAVLLVSLSCKAVLAETPLIHSLKIRTGLSLIHDDNVFHYSQKFRNAFDAKLRPGFFREQNTNSLGDIITEPFLRIRYLPFRSDYAPTFSAGLSGSFYRQNPSLNNRSYFVGIEQGLGHQTDISVTYEEFLIQSITATTTMTPTTRITTTTTTITTFKTVGVDLQHDFQIFQGDIFADFTNEDRNYGVGLTTAIPFRYLDLDLSYRFDLYLPNSGDLGYRSHQFRVEPSFPITEKSSLDLYGDIQKNRYTTGINSKKTDDTVRWGVVFYYEMSERIMTQLGFDRIRWNTDRDIQNPSYDKNVITIKVSLAL